MGKWYNYLIMIQKENNNILNKIRFSAFLICIVFFALVFMCQEDYSYAKGNTINLINPVSGSGWDVDEAGNITIKKDGTYTIDGKSKKTSNTITVVSGSSVTLELNNVQIEYDSSEKEMDAISFEENCKFDLKFKGNNSIHVTNPFSEYIGSSGNTAISFGEGCNGTFVGEKNAVLDCKGKCGILVESHSSVVFKSGVINCTSLVNGYSALGNSTIYKVITDLSLRFTDSVIVKCKASTYGAGIGFSGEAYSDVVVIDSPNNEIIIDKNAHVTAVGGGSMAGIGAEKFYCDISIKDNAYVHAVGGDSELGAYAGSTAPMDFLSRVDPYMAGSGIGSGGYTANYVGDLFIEDEAVVIAEGGDAEAKHSVGFHMGNAGAGIGPAGMTVCFRRPMTLPIQSNKLFLKEIMGMSDAEISEKYPVFNQTYFSPLSIHSLGVYAKGGASDTYPEAPIHTVDYASAGSNIGTGGTIKVGRMLTRDSVVDGFTREGISQIIYHTNSKKDTALPLQYYEDKITLPSTDRMKKFNSSFPNQRYSEWSEDSSATKGYSEGHKLSKAIDDLYLIQNPILMEVKFNEKNQDVSGHIDLLFNEEMSTNLDGAKAILINNKSRKQTPLALDNVQWSDGNMTCTIDYSDLDSNTRYSLIVSGFTDVDNNGMREDEPIAFKTVKSKDDDKKEKPATPASGANTSDNTPIETIIFPLIFSYLLLVTLLFRKLKRI